MVVIVQFQRGFVAVFWGDSTLEEISHRSETPVGQEETPRALLVLMLLPAVLMLLVALVFLVVVV